MMTIKNKVLAILLAMAFNAFAAAWTGSNSEPENMKKIDGKAFYVITTADELAWFAVQVNSGRSAINAVLGNDIVFGANNSSTCTAKWTPIGNSTSAQFAGILDGAGHTIYGLYTNEISLSGLVGVLGKNGIVRNLNTIVGNINGTLRSGGIVAHNVGLVQNVKNGNKVNVSTSTETAVYAGGIVAHNEGSVENCSSSGAIKASSTTNTALGIAKARAGGIAGHSTGSIVNSINSGSVSSFARAQNPNKYGEAFAGGIAGYNSSIVKICKNGGAVVAQGSGDNTGEFISRSAGIVGYNAANVNNCSNTGSTSIKRIYESDDKSYFTTDYSKSCPSCVGGIVAFGEVKNSFDVVSYKYWLNGGAIQGAAENMKKDQFAWILNTTNGTTSNSGVWSRTDGYPIFATETNKPIYKVVFNDEGVTTNRYTSNKGLASFPENPEPAEGFVFTGWYNANDVRVKPTTVFTADQTVNAVYVDASEVFWTINFFNTDAKSTLLETKSYQHGSIVTYGGGTPTKETTAQYTYTFKGWDVEPTNAVEDFDYHAVYDSTIRSYVITFNNFDGTKIESGSFEYGKMPSCSKTPSRATTAEWKYTHKGWKPALDYVTEDASYTALFDSSNVEYQVTFLNGTTVIDEQMIPYGGAAVAPTNVTREGYKFVGWNATFANVTENLTVKALFEELITYIVKVVGANDEKIDSVKVEENETYVLPIAPKKDGYTFDAYYNGDNKIGIAGTEISVVSDITITAKYSKNPEGSSSSVARSSSSSVKSSSSNGESQVVVEGELEQIVAPGEYIDPIFFKNVKKYNRNSSHISFIQALPSQGSDELAIVGLVPEYYKVGVYTESWTINGSIYTVKLTIVSNNSSSSVKSSSSSAKTSIAMQNSMPKFRVFVNSRSIQLSGADVGNAYVLLDMQGRILQKGRVETANFNIAVPNAGQYFVRIGSQIRNVNVR
jgi:hypothetical protein